MAFEKIRETLSNFVPMVGAPAPAPVEPGPSMRPDSLRSVRHLAAPIASHTQLDGKSLSAWRHEIAPCLRANGHAIGESQLRSQLAQLHHERQAARTIEDVIATGDHAQELIAQINATAVEELSNSMRKAAAKELLPAADAGDIGAITHQIHRDLAGTPEERARAQRFMQQHGKGLEHLVDTIDDSHLRDIAHQELADVRRLYEHAAEEAAREAKAKAKRDAELAAKRYLDRALQLKKEAIQKIELTVRAAKERDAHIEEGVRRGNARVLAQEVNHDRSQAAADGSWTPGEMSPETV